eukprot:1066700-Rhodomonas_salina.3
MARSGRRASRSEATEAEQRLGLVFGPGCREVGADGGVEIDGFERLGCAECGRLFAWCGFACLGVGQLCGFARCRMHPSMMMRRLDVFVSDSPLHLPTH